MDDFHIARVHKRPNRGYTGKSGPFCFNKYQLLLLSEFVFSKIDYKSIPEGVVNSCLIPAVSEQLIEELRGAKIELFLNSDGYYQLRVSEKYISLALVQK